MKFNLIIDKSKEEEITATVHGRSPLTDKIEAFVTQYGKTDRIPVFSEDELKILPFSETECILVEDGKTFAAGFCVIWLIIYLCIRRKTDDINNLRREKN